MQEHVNTAEVIGRNIDFLTIEAVTDSIPAQKLSTFQQQRAGVTAGSVAKPTTFDISVSGCTGNPTQPTTISSKFAGNSITVGGNLGNVATGTTAATNAEIQILDTAAAPINFTTPFTASGDLTLATAADSASATYTAQYISEAGVATPGAVQASMQYAVSYN